MAVGGFEGPDAELHARDVGLRVQSVNLHPHGANHRVQAVNLHIRRPGIETFTKIIRKLQHMRYRT